VAFFGGAQRLVDDLAPHGYDWLQILWPDRSISAQVRRAVREVLEAFAGGRPDRFVRETVDRLLSRVPRGIWKAAPALIVWILVLLASDRARWLKYAWACFDIAVAAAFGRLSLTLYRPLARVLFGVVLADAWLTTAQAVFHNLPNLHGPLDTAFAAMPLRHGPLKSPPNLSWRARHVQLEPRVERSS